MFPSYYYNDGYDNENYQTEEFIYLNLVWQIMSFEDGINQKILIRTFEQLFAMIDRHSKVVVMRFDVRLYTEAENNQLMTKFRERLIKQVKKNNNSNTCHVGFVWVREQTSTAANPHYHFAIFLDGHKTHKSFGLKPLIETACQSLIDLSVFYPKNNCYMVHYDSTKSIQQVMVRLSYMAKNYSKGNRPMQTSDYQTSRLKSLKT